MKTINKIIKEIEKLKKSEEWIIADPLECFIKIHNDKEYNKAIEDVIKLLKDNE